MPILIKRIDEKVGKKDGFRVYIERAWPLGLKREDAEVNLWLYDVAPGEGEQAWFSGKAERWGEFECGYFAELDEKIHRLQPLVELAAHGPVTLLYKEGVSEYNNAVAIKDYILAKLTPAREAA